MRRRIGDDSPSIGPDINGAPGVIGQIEINVTRMLGDADVDAAVDATVFGAFANAGQICMSTERVIVDTADTDTPAMRAMSPIPNHSPGFIARSMRSATDWPGRARDRLRFRAAARVRSITTCRRSALVRFLLATDFATS